MKTPSILLFAVCAIALGLASCGTEYPLTGSLTYRDPESGAKAGLVFTPGAPPKASVKVPVYDPETGELVGMADLQAEIPVNRKSGK